MVFLYTIRAAGWRTMALLLTAVLAAACASPQKERQYRSVVSRVIPMGQAGRSRDQIDQYPTYEVFFRFDRRIDSLRVVGGASSAADPLTAKKRNYRTYLVLERVIDARRFGRGGGFIYVEMGRNFDAAWKSRKELVIDRTGSDPLAILDESSVYRIRVTTFNAETADITVEVHADAEITVVAGP